jgi:hypothetical protein
MLNIIAGVFSEPTAAATNSYESIATFNGAGSSGICTFSSIPATYKHLQVRYSILPSAANNYSTLRFNGDTTTANYRYHYLYGDGSTTGAGSAQNAYSGSYNSTTHTGIGVLDILDYANTSKNKTTRELCGFDANGSGTAYFISNLWMNTAAINQITFTLNSGNFATGSKIALYGIKG